MLTLTETANLIGFKALYRGIKSPKSIVSIPNEK